MIVGVPGHASAAESGMRVVANEMFHGFSEESSEESAPVRNAANGHSTAGMCVWNGRKKCKRTASVGSTYCSAHLCPDCEVTGKKSNDEMCIECQNRAGLFGGLFARNEEKDLPAPAPSIVRIDGSADVEGATTSTDKTVDYEPEMPATALTNVDYGELYEVRSIGTAVTPACGMAFCLYNHAQEMGT